MIKPRSCRPHAWHGLCLNCSFGSGESSFLLSSPALCFYGSPLPISFFFFLSGIHLFVFLLHSSLCHSDLPFIMLPYLTMWSDTSPLLSALVYFHPLCLSTSLGFSLFIPLSCPVSPFFFLRPASLHSVTLPKLLTHMHARTSSHSHMHRVTHGHFLAEISWPIWALWHCPLGLCTIVHVTCIVCVYVCAHAHWNVCVSTCVTESASRSVK